MGRVVLIDGDVMCYRSGFAVQKTGYKITFANGEVVSLKTKTDLDEYLNSLSDEAGEFEIEKTIELEPIENCLHILKQTITKITLACSARPQIYLSGGGNFRKELATIKPYKGNRDPFAKPVYLPEMMEYLQERWGAELIVGMEADDAMGIEQTKPGADTVIASTDKDLKMIPGRHYDWVKDKKLVVSERDAWRSFYKQMLTGDNTDNIPGIPGVGPKTASKLLDEVATPTTMWRVVREQYAEHYPNGYDEHRTVDEAILEIGNLLWIRRHNHERWEPPT